MIKQGLTSLAILAMLGGITALAEPLDYAKSYTTAMDATGNPTADFFPLSILRDEQFDIIGALGYTFSDGGGHCCYEFREGLPCTYKFNPLRPDRGVYFASLWSAHSLYISRQSKNYGTLKNSIGDNGKPHGNHMLSIFDPQTVKYVLDCEKQTVKTIIERHPGNIFMWGIDNEWETPLDYSPEAKTAFRNWLEVIYAKDLSKLNRAWGRSYQSFAEAEPPAIADFKTAPGAWLDWRRFQEESYTDFIVKRFKTISEADPKHRPMISKSTQCTLEMTAVAKKRLNNHEMLAAKARNYNQGWYGIDMYGHGDRNSYEFGYLYNCALPNDPADRKFRDGLYVAETNNHAGPGWQFAETYWRTLANGIKGFNFFTLGFFGAEEDWATFAFTDAETGSRLSRFYYAGRLGSMIHRSEAFWANCIPAGTPRIAMLMPQRDIMLAEDSGVSWWDYSKNNRLNVYSRLRNHGYWVEAIPYGKLNTEFMRRYQALVLVDAEHLAATESAAIIDFVNRGGVLLADNRPGYFDEHHNMVRSLDSLLGVDLGDVYKGIDVSPDDVWYQTADDNMIRGDGKINAVLKNAVLLNKKQVDINAKAARLTLNQYGKGQVYWFNTRLGVLRAECGPDSIVSDWLGRLLEKAGVKPGYQITGNDTSRVRVEAPLTDKNGNCAILVANTIQEPVAPFKLTINLPKGKYGKAFWAAAEETSLQPLEVSLEKDGRYVFHMPKVITAGVIYMFPQHHPLVGLAVKNVTSHPDHDRWTAELKPGQTVEVEVQLVNPAMVASAAGIVRLAAYADWNVTPASQKVEAIEPGGIKTFKFQVTVPVTSPSFRPNTVYPLVAYWENGGKVEAQCNAFVTMALEPAKTLRRLSDNPAHFMNLGLEALRTGASYTYSATTGSNPWWKDPATAKEPCISGGNALISGTGKEAVFKMPEIDVIFDLKKAYKVSKVKAIGSKTNFPAGFDVSVSTDGKTYHKVGTSEGIWTTPEKNVDFAPVQGRYVKINLKFNKSQGVLNEIEIWGTEQ